MRHVSRVPSHSGFTPGGSTGKKNCTVHNAAYVHIRCLGVLAETEEELQNREELWNDRKRQRGRGSK